MFRHGTLMVLSLISLSAFAQDSVITGPVTTTQTGTAGADSLLISETGSISVNGNPVMYNQGGTDTIVNNGTIVGGFSGGGGPAAGYLIYTTGAGSLVINNGTASFSSSSHYSNGIEMDGANSTVINNGTVSARSVFNPSTVLVAGANSTLVNNGTLLSYGLDANGSQNVFISGNNVTVNNQGTIIADAAVRNNQVIGVFGLFAPNTTVINDGTIQGVVGVDFSSGANSNELLVNSGVIRSTGLTAIVMSGFNDTVTLKSGSRIIGQMDGGAGNDTLNINLSGVSAAKKVEIQALAASGTGKFFLHGDLFDFKNFENVNVNTISYEQSGTTNNSRAIGKYMDNLPTFSDDLSKIFHGIDISGNTTQALRQLTPEINTIGSEMGVQNIHQVSDLLLWRQSFGGPTDLSMLYKRSALTETAAMGSPSDFGQLFNAKPEPASTTQVDKSLTEEQKKWAIWANGYGIWTDRDSGNDRTGYTAVSKGGIVGFDRLLGKNWLAGGYFGFSSADADVDNFNSRVNTQSYDFGAYTTYAFQNGVYANANLGYGFDTYDVRRGITFGNIYRTAKSDHDGQHLNTEFGAGYNYKTGIWQLGPVFNLQYIHMMEDGYSEKGAGDVSLQVKDSSFDSLRTTLGGRVAANLKAFHGKVVFSPELRVRWAHEFLNSDEGLTSNFVGIGSAGGTFRTRGTRADDDGRDSAFLGAGLTATIKRNISAYVNYDADIGRSNYFSQGVQGGFRIKF